VGCHFVAKLLIFVCKNIFAARNRRPVKEKPVKSKRPRARGCIIYSTIIVNYSWYCTVYLFSGIAGRELQWKKRIMVTCEILTGP
jgi:hypothetical protein